VPTYLLPLKANCPGSMRMAATAAIISRSRPLPTLPLAYIERAVATI
jgi:hypothetical protein